jgi:hypothetical protein
MWTFVKSAVEGECELFGVNIFDYKWQNTGDKAKVLDPIYNQEHEMIVYSVEIAGREFTFATGEFSNCVYGFYTNEDSNV